MADRARPAAALALALGLLAAAPRADVDPVFPVVDLHVDLPWQVHLKKRGDTLEKGHVTVASLARGNVAGIVLPLYLPDDLHADGPHPADLEAMYRAMEKLVWTASLPFAPLPEGKPPRVRTWLAMEGAQALAEDTASTGSWVKRGIRLVGLAHGHDNALAGSSTGAKRGGLTDKGRDVAKRALAAGALLDVSHLSDAAFDDALALSREAGAPLVASHSDARAVANHPRNLTDAQLRALGATGGIVGVNFHRPYVTTKPTASLADVVAQLDHLVAEAGEDHVAIGSDYDGGIAPPASLPDAGHFPTLARALLDHGWPESRVRKVFSENALRVLDRLAQAPGFRLQASARGFQLPASSFQPGSRGGGPIRDGVVGLQHGSEATRAGGANPRGRERSDPRGQTSRAKRRPSMRNAAQRPRPPHPPPTGGARTRTLTTGTPRPGPRPPYKYEPTQNNRSRAERRDRLRSRAQRGSLVSRKDLSFTRVFSSRVNVGAS